MAIRKFSIAEPGVKSNKVWDQDAAQGAMIPIGSWALANSEVFTFSNIPQSFQDLMIVISGVNHLTGGSIAIDAISNSSTSDRSYTMLHGNGTATLGTRNTNINYIAMAYVGGSVSNISPTSVVLHILDYANTTRNKTFLYRSAAELSTSGDITVGVGRMNSTVAITQFNITTQVPGRFWGTGSRLTIYGIKAGA